MIDQPLMMNRDGGLHNSNLLLTSHARIAHRGACALFSLDFRNDCLIFIIAWTNMIQHTA